MSEFYSWSTFEKLTELFDAGKWRYSDRQANFALDLIDRAVSSGNISKRQLYFLAKTVRPSLLRGVLIPKMAKNSRNKHELWIMKKNPLRVVLTQLPKPYDPPGF